MLMSQIMFLLLAFLVECEIFHSVIESVENIVAIVPLLLANSMISWSGAATKIFGEMGLLVQ